MPNILCIYNPKSGAGSVEKRIPKFLKTIEDLSVEYDTLKLIDDDFDSQLTESLKTKIYDSILGIGGDGTHHSLINQILNLHDSQPDLELPAYAFCPFGTGNDIARSIGLKVGEEHYQSIIETATSGEIKAYDIGFALNRYFADMISFGIDCNILSLRDHYISERLKKHKTASVRFGYWAYLKAIVKSLTKTAKLSGKIFVDDKLFYEGEFKNLIINNCPLHAAHFDITPGANSFDGIFDALLSLSSRQYITDHLAAYRSDSTKLKAKGSENKLRIRGKCFQIELDAPTMIQMDGELIKEENNFTINCLAKKLKIRIPQS